jgi:hypothetical protein
MIKTMKDSELKVFLEKLPDYIKHFFLNEDSMIAKIYGVYSFERLDV